MRVTEVRTVFLTGELDFAATEALRATLDDAVATNDDILVDLSGVHTLDSGGIRELLRAQALAAQAGKEFGVVSPSAHARRMLELAHANGLLHADPTTRRETARREA